MLSLPIGPLVLPTGPLLAFAAVALAMAAARRLAPPDPEAGRADDALLTAVVVGMLGGRLAHLALHADAYRLTPWAALDPRDGGWHLPTALAVGLAALGVQVRRTPAWRRALAVGAAVGLTAWGAGQLGLRALTPQGLPDVTFVDLKTGADVRLIDLADGRPVVLNLWASWCGPCRAEMPDLAAAQDRHPDVRFVFANQGEAAPAVRRYLASAGLDLDLVVLDPASRTGELVGSSGLPTTVFFDAEGRRVDAHMGSLNAAAVSAKLSAHGMD